MSPFHKSFQQFPTLSPGVNMKPAYINLCNAVLSFFWSMVSWFVSFGATLGKNLSK